MKETQNKTVRKSKYQRHPKNPYRESSNYAKCFDILAAHDSIRRDKLVALYAKETGKDISKGAKWDTVVVCSSDPDGTAHKSCKANCYFVEKGAGGSLRLRFR